MEIKTIKISAKGQLCIPQEMRKEVGFKEGDQLVMIAKENQIILKKSKEIINKINSTERL